MILIILREKVGKISLPSEGKSREISLFPQREKVGNYREFPSEGKSRENTEIFPPREKVYII